MNNNVNAFSMNTASTKEISKPTVKAAARTVNTKQENFSQTLDQAQQARSKNTLSKDNGQGTVSNKPDTDAKDAVNAKAQGTDKADDKALAGDAAANDQPKAGKSDAKADDAAANTGTANSDDAKLDNIVQPGAQDAAALLAAQAQASLVQDMPMAELNTYFKGDARLQNVQDGVQVQATAAVDNALLPQMQQTDNQQQESPLTSLQPAEALVEVQKVDKAENAEGGQPVESPKSYAPNDIAALLGARAQAVSSESNVYQSQQAQGQQMLNLLAGQQGAVYAAQPAVQQVQENTVSVTQLANLTDGVEVVNADNQQEISVASVQQQSLLDDAQQQSMSNGEEQQQGNQLLGEEQQLMSSSQGQQQGSQLPGEASFDVVLPSQQNDAPAESNEISHQQQGITFQQVMDNQTAVQQANGDVSQTNQPRETYNVPQQIVEQAKLLQRGADSEMIIKLNPEHLGQLSLRVSVNGNGGVTATFHTDNAQVRAILETTMTQLKQQLDEQGIKVDNVEVQTGLPDGQLPQDQGQQGFYQQQGQEVRSQQADLKDFEESSENLSVEAEEQSPEVVLDSQGNQISRGVDYTV